MILNDSKFLKETKLKKFILSFFKRKLKSSKSRFLSFLPSFRPSFHSFFPSFPFIPIVISFFSFFVWGVPVFDFV